MKSDVVDLQEANERIAHVEGHHLKLTNQHKVYWPKDGYTKGDVIEYYDQMFKYIIPHLRGRPQSLKRNPEGLRTSGFYHKDAGDLAPDWVETIGIKSKSTSKKVEYIVCNDKATLLYLNNLGCIELNPWHSRVGHLTKPDYFVIDIDPAKKNTFDQVIDVAQVVRDVLKQAGADGYCKTSGATGLHVYVPLGAKYTYQQAAQFAQIIATMTHEQLPQTTSLVRSLVKRGQKIYVDYLQNSIGQTLASAYSLRPRPGATASAPLRWSEVKPGLDPMDFTIQTMPKRAKRSGDLFEGVLGKGINLQACLKKLGA
jgi:bifunctional non-homologous end joining protein LigD